MANGKKEEDSLNLLIGLILIVIVALLLILAFSSLSPSPCPEGTFSCDLSISRCGCCVEGPYGDPIESCDIICPEGTFFYRGRGCCTPDDRCDECKDVIPCGEGNCCLGDECLLQKDGSYKCIPCRVGAICNPDNVNGCCEGLACDSDGRCKNITKCKGMPCENYDLPCKICSTTDDDCIDCEDDTICYKNPVSGKGICTEMCDPLHPACPECPTGCCLPDGGCPSCENNPCDTPGVYCAYSSTIPCDEICANVGGQLLCKNRGGCPEGYVECDCETGCCDAVTGECLTCEDNECENEGSQCIYCEDGECVPCPDTICHEGICKSTKCVGPDCFYEPPPGPTDPERKCKEGDKIIVVDGKLRLCVPLYFKSICSPGSCEGKNEGDSCTIKLGNPPNCNYFCHEVNDELKCLSEDEIIPPWLLNYKLTCIEVCEDCNPCNYDDLSIYDLNEDTYLNGLDLEFFDDMLGWPETQSREAVGEFKKYDFNNDGVIDEIDRECLLGACGDGTCRLLGFEELGICVTDEYYYNSYTEEQRAVIPNFEDLFKIRSSIDNTYTCDGIDSSFTVPCLAFKNTFNTHLSVGKLSYVLLEKNKLKYYYSTCSYTTGLNDGTFMSYIEPDECSNIMNIYVSKDFFNTIVAHETAMFYYCLNNQPNAILGDYNFKGNCDGYKKHIKDTCVSYLPYNPPGNSKDKIPYDDKYNKLVNICEEISIKTTEYCKFATQSYNRLPFYFFTHYGHRYEECYAFNLTAPNCILYSDCIDVLNFYELCENPALCVGICKNLAIDSYWVSEEEGVASKELYCYFKTLVFQSDISARYVDFIIDAVSYNTLSSAEPVQYDVKFKGFMEECPSNIFCEHFPEKCGKPTFSGVRPNFDRIEYNAEFEEDEIEITIDRIRKEKDPSSTGATYGGGFTYIKGKAGGGLATKMQQDFITATGQGKFMNRDADFSGGGIGDYGGGGGTGGTGGTMGTGGGGGMPSVNPDLGGGNNNRNSVMDGKFNMNGIITDNAMSAEIGKAFLNYN